MNINVTVDSIDLDSVIGEEYDYEAEEREPITLGQRIAKLAAKRIATSADSQPLRDQIRAMRVEEMKARVTAEIEEVMAAPIQRTNTYGEPAGSTFTLREEIARLAAEAFKPQVRDGYGRGQETPMQALIRTEIDKVLTKELAAVFAEEKAKVVAVVRAKAADLIATAVKEGLGR